MDLKIRNINLDKSIRLPFQLESKFTPSQTLLLRLSKKNKEVKIDFELKNLNWDKKNINLRVHKVFNTNEHNTLPAMISFICKLLNKEYEILSFKISKKTKEQTKDYFSKSNEFFWSDNENNLEISK